MNRNIFIILIALICNVSFAQDFKELANSEFESAESYKPAEKQVLVCANYLFENPANQAELNRLHSIQYIMKWMTGTPDYTFDIGQKAMELTKGKSDLLGLYMAAMSKVVIENEGEELDSDQIYDQAEKILVNYCSEPNNKIKPTRKIKKLIKAS
ncbi:hypothetical protein RM545_01920 [Zunongwangia sp. F260]|uniref:Uncharacterized protein n=1 Tax=Autumnicola lenta TaxID=3075593 RepID=A0ABU3CGQ3_9FLAO|nr:hypothetical protein [Zunongwangia sp. F260]MDT0645433.1 hypothetical protein [Zunongwangia sp. F260]